MAKQILIDLVFNANTSQAKSQMASLQNQLNQLQNTNRTSILGEGLTKDLAQVQSSLISLKTNLQSAFNVDTGRLDLSKFNANLKAGGMTLQTYRLSLQSMGVEGREAFNKLTNAIVQGELPLRRTKNLLTSMMNTFGSSIKWSIAYGAIDGIRQGFQNAFQYAKDLNESLTNIGIVAQKSTQEMSKFAEQANKAAKSLASTTVAYTDAALIYYQQGLSDDQVAERAATTMKLANVVGESAQTVSEWMTAIWNNFDDGSKKLEYYGDVLAKLGAETASSADEIAQGFEKFAAVADTVGLSYEKGAAAIATVTATTRQSADVVGTAFKTLFARIQDLELGNTLDDGTTLGQYSEALNKVGINIKTTSGDLKEMDVILAEMGSTWKTLSNDEQVALAKSVAGIRQYTQLIALMENYDYFEQLTTSAENATGTLEEQQDRWAESWEASSNRVKAASEGIYSNLINDEFFIDLNNVFADLLTLVDGLMDAMGGLKTILPAIGGLMMYAFGPTILTSIKGFVSNLQGVKASEIASLQSMSRDALKEQVSMHDYAQDTQTRTASTIAKEELKTQEKIWGIKRKISDEEAQRLQQGNQKLLNLKEELMTLAKQSDELQEQQAILLGNKKGMVNNFASNFGKDKDKVLNQTKELSNEVNKYATMKEKDFDPEAAKADIIARRGAGASFKHLGIPGNKDLKQFDLTLAKMREIEAATNKQGITTQAVTQKKEALIGKLIELGVSEDEARSRVNELTFELQENSAAFSENGTKIRKVETALKQGGETYEAEADKFREQLEKTKKMPLGDAFVQTAGAVSMLTAGISSLTTGLSSLYDMWTSDTWTFEGVIQGISGVAMSISMILPGLKMMKGLFLQGALGVGLETAALQINAAAIEKNWHKKMKLTKEEQIAYIQKKLNISAEEAAAVANILNEQTIKKQKATTEESRIAIEKETAAIWENIAAETADATNPEEGPAISKGTANLFGGKGKIGWAKIGKFAAGIAIAAVTLAAMAAIYKAADNAWNAASRAAEQAKKDATAMAEQYQNTKTEYEDLKSTLEDYNKSRSAIDSLTEGTKEWQKAIQEANQETLELLQKYPQLLEMEGAIDRTNGQIQLTAEGQQALLDQQSKELTQSYNNQLYANLNAQDKALQSSRTDLTRNELDTGAGAEWANGAIGGAGVGVIGGLGGYMAAAALVGSIVPGIGTAIGAAIGAAIGIGVGVAAGIKNGDRTDQNAKDADSALNVLTEKAQSLEGGVTELNSNWQANIDALQQEGKISEALAKELKENTTAEKVQNQLLKEEQQRKLREEAENQVTQQYLTNAGFIGWNQYGDNVSSMSNTERTKLEAEVIEKAGYKLIGYGVSDNYEEWDGGLRNANTEADKVAEKYKELLKEEFDAINVKFTNFNWTDKTFDFKYKDEQGEWQKVSRSFETVSEAVKQDLIAESNLEKDLLEYTTDLTNEIARLQNSRAQGANLVASFLSNGSISNITGEDLRETEGKSAEEIWKQIENVDELATSFGLSFDKFEEAYNKFNTIENRLNALVQWNTEELASARDTFKNQAEALDTTAEALEGYMFHLIKENSALQNNIGVAKEATLQNFKLAKGIKDLKVAFDEEFEVLQEGNKNSIEYYESLGKLEQIIEQIFGLSVSGDFVANNLEKIQDLANGSTKAFQELRKAANESFIDSWGVDTNLANALKNELDELTNEIYNKDLSIGAELTLDSSGAIDALNQALLSGKATIEEIESLFNNANIKMPQPRQLVLPIATTSKSITYVGGMPVSETSTENITMQTVPYFGETPEIKKVTKTIQYNEYDEQGNITKPNQTMEYTTWEAASTSSTEATEIEVESLGDTTTDTAITDYGGETETEKVKRAKELDDEVDHYHEIERAIENTERELDALAEAKDRAFGADKLALMKDEIAKYEELLGEQQQLIDKAKERYEVEKQNLLSNYAVELNDEGEITNYNELIQQQVDKLKGMDSGTDAYKTEEAYLEQMKEDFEQYEEELSKMKDTQQEFIDLQYELADLALEKIEYTVSLKVDIAEDDMAYIDFLMSQIEDDAFAVAEKVALQSDAVKSVTKQIEATEFGIQEIMDDVNSQGFMTDAQAEQLREYRDNLIDYESQLREIKTTVEESLTEAYDAWNEKLDENISKFDHYASVLDSYKNIIELTGKKNLGITNDMMREMSRVQVQNAQNLLASSKATMDANKAVLETYKKNYENATTEDDKKYWEDQVKIAEKNVMSSTESFMSNWENALQAAADAFAENVGLIVEEFESSIAGIYGSLEALQEEFDRQGEINERYLADYEKTYEFSKLNRQIQNSIDKTDSTKSQKELKGLQQELLALQESGNKVSQRDIEFLQKKYDLMLKEQALRDAQNAKSVVRLQRDSEGNYNYVYTADQSNISQAQQEYEDSLYELEKWGEESLNTIQETILSIEQEFADAIAQVNEKYAGDTEKIEAETARLTQYYQGQLKYWVDEAEKMVQHGSEINIKYNTDMADSYHDTVIGQMLPEQTSWQSFYENSQKAMQDASDNFLFALNGEGNKNSFTNMIAEAYKAAGESVETFVDALTNSNDGYLTQVQKASDETAEATSDMADDMGEYMTDAAGYVSDFQETYSGYMDDVWNSTNKVILKIGELIGKYQGMETAAKEAKAAQDALSGSGEDTSGNDIVNLKKDDTIIYSDTTSGTSNITLKNAYIGGSNYWEYGGKYYKKGNNEGHMSTKTVSDLENLEEVKIFDMSDYLENRTYNNIYEGTKKVDGWLWGRDATEEEKPYIVKRYNKYGKRNGSNKDDWQVDSLSKSFGNAVVLGYQYISDGDCTHLFKLGNVYDDNGNLWGGTGNFYINWTDLSQILGISGEAELNNLRNPYGSWINGKWVSNQFNASFDTGGYTGAWGPEGRMAMLHQKEIVLNAQDTENFLSAIQIVRSIADQLETNALAAKLGLTAYSAATVKTQGDTLQQEVHITAEFPNATNHSEIEEAFRNLNLMASQYANRKN